MIGIDFFPFASFDRCVSWNVGQSARSQRNLKLLEVIRNSCCEFFMSNFLPTLLSLLIIYVLLPLCSVLRLVSVVPFTLGFNIETNRSWIMGHFVWQSMMRRLRIIDGLQSRMLRGWEWRSERESLGRFSFIPWK